MSSSSKSKRIIGMLVIDIVFLALELAVGIAVGSLALLADAFHMLNDVISLIVGLWAVLVAQKSSTDKYSFGYLRAEVLGAFFNAVFLIALCFSIILEATQRLLDPPKIDNPKLILIVGIFGLASNLGGFFILGGHGHSHGHENSTHSHHNGTQTAQESSSQLNQKTRIDRDDGLIGYKSTFDQPLHISVSDDESSKPCPISLKRSPRKTSMARTSLFKKDDFSIHPASFRQNIIAASKPQADSKHTGGSDTETDEEYLETEENEPTEFEPLMARQKKLKNKVLSKTDKKDKNAERHGEHDHHKLKISEVAAHFHTDMGMNAIILHVIGDALGNLGVIVSGLIIWLTEWPSKFYADPAVSLFITLIILRSAIPLTVATAKILLQATPDHIEVGDIKNDINALPGVAHCHHVHIWQLSDTQLVASMHIHFEFSLSEVSEEKYMDTAKAVRKCLHAYGIHSVTIQPEFCHVKSNTSGSNSKIKPNFDGTASLSRCGLDVDECMLECVDDCQGKPCCIPKAT
ncbi:Cation diffusion facilitator family protein 1 [Golovinomyces cichoracearum]|uniref:Cation diffusion facilitator family protein 1 n=1 Tax=Golovinomyces cichoracearum TaxID=62708 RepID=A0A420INB1_9PEZI|nr:Cation diffusion facilitator family protein 1 [Golovinomyces cichoracearum]